MDLEKRYKTSEGIECSILQLVKMAPARAAKIIQNYERRMETLEAASKTSTNEHVTDGKTPSQIADDIGSYICGQERTGCLPVPAKKLNEWCRQLRNT